MCSSFEVTGTRDKWISEPSLCLSLLILLTCGQKGELRRKLFPGLSWRSILEALISGFQCSCSGNFNILFCDRTSSPGTLHVLRPGPSLIRLLTARGSALSAKWVTERKCKQIWWKKRLSDGSISPSPGQQQPPAHWEALVCVINCSRYLTSKTIRD